MTEDETVAWYHRLNEHELVQTPGDGEGQGSLISCSPCGCKQSDTTEQLNRTELNVWKFLLHILLKPILQDFEHYLPSL